MKKIENKYWQQRQKQYFANLEKDEKKLYQNLSKEYAKEAKRLDKEIATYYSKYGADDVIEYKTLLTELDKAERKILIEDMNEFFRVRPELEHLRPIRESVYKIDRLDSLRYSITKGQIELGEIEQQKLLDHLSKNYVSTYDAVIKDMGFGEQFLSIDRTRAEQLVNTKWIANRNFSDSIWSNKEKLINYMAKDFTDGVIRGDNYDKLGKILLERFDKVNKNDIKRLVYTEGTFVQNQAMAQPFQDMGYTHYSYDAILDDRTTDICEGLNGQIFAFADKEPGVNFPPMHSWCRSSFTVEKNRGD